MLAIQKSDSKNCTPHLLPVRINHNGRINSTPQYWTPTADEKGTQHVHFRGRHLHGTHLPLPEGYTGVVLRVTDKIAANANANTNPHAHEHQDEYQDEDAMQDAMDAEEEQREQVKTAEQLGEFDALVVWGHGGEVDSASDLFVRGVQEWVRFAEDMHCDEEDEQVKTQSKP